MTGERTSWVEAWHRLAAMACAALLAAGCAVAPAEVASRRTGPCGEAFARVDQAVSRAGVADGLATRIRGFPHLRADRFLASYARENLDQPRHAEWLRRMGTLATTSYAYELANLPPRDAEALQQAVRAIVPGETISVALSRCADVLAAADLSEPGRRAALEKAVVVPDAYSTLERAAGLYWLTRVPFSLGVRRWQEEVREAFEAPLPQPPAAGALRRYVPPGALLSPPEVAAILARGSANALGIPTPVGRDLDQLFEIFAPAYAVETAGDADVPGRVEWDDGNNLRVAHGPAVVYRRVSHARHQGRVLLQLNYWLWFPERPTRGAWDLLGGRLDGVLWRVTLSPAGSPLVFDSIHPCGCYHLFFPTARAIAKPQPATLDEPGFVPTVLPAVEAGQRIELRLDASTHYLRRVIVGSKPADGSQYAFAEDDALRSLPLPGGGRRSAFRPDGIVPGTERSERWVFWPMGVREAGAMRQWGHHATAFVGRRHFDDPGLLSRYFDLAIIP